jgi:hypothetical protein
MFKKKHLSDKVKALKKAIKSKTYDWNSAIADTANRIIEYPQSLAWR